MRGYDRSLRFDNNAASRRQSHRRQRRKIGAWLRSLRLVRDAEMKRVVRA